MRQARLRTAVFALLALCLTMAAVAADRPVSLTSAGETCSPWLFDGCCGQESANRASALRAASALSKSSA
jgi:hypothetical protein